MKFLIIMTLVLFGSAQSLMACPAVCNSVCIGSADYGGPCYAGYGGPRYAGYGGPCYTGFGGACAFGSIFCPEACSVCQ